MSAQALASEAHQRLLGSPDHETSQQHLAGLTQRPQPSLAGMETAGQVQQHVLEGLQAATQPALQQHLEQQLSRQLAAAMQHLPGQLAAAVQQWTPQLPTSDAADGVHSCLTAVNQQLAHVASQAHQMQAAQEQQMPVLDRLDSQLPAEAAGIRVRALSSCTLLALAQFMAYLPEIH